MVCPSLSERYGTIEMTAIIIIMILFFKFNLKVKLKTQVAIFNES